MHDQDQKTGPFFVSSVVPLFFSSDFNTRPTKICQNYTHREQGKTEKETGRDGETYARTHKTNRHGLFSAGCFCFLLHLAAEWEKRKTGEEREIIKEREGRGSRLLLCKVDLAILLLRCRVLGGND
ncbi:hypothetical protein VTJ04DRAFT_8940 [Mycothermus thermophilus]|uniref:uncharacterized protein n=1 Tax=Humicola insolens TaxID=85995 RepID=UPI003744AC9D